ncbi:MAG: hypothetical protein C7N36_19450 [Bacteroidetes bacterium]|nr:MAG: hypothetical protein C7N36_19450 [Bacteroidota bacterium]
MKNHIVYLARFIVETATPMAIGSGERGSSIDRLIARDTNGLPYIPGTSLAGVIRHEMDPEGNSLKIGDVFGFQGASALGEAEEGGQGSRIIFSPGMLLAEEGQRVHEGLEKIDFEQGFYSYFQKLPERDHVRITHRGAADVQGHGKYDEELVHKGTRFVFEIELAGTAADTNLWQTILSLLHQPFFRIGAGTRKGFGKLDVISCHTKIYDLKAKPQLLAYLAKSSSLNGDYTDWIFFGEAAADTGRFIRYEVDLQPESFFHFGAGFGDEDVDMKPKTERFFDWSSGKATLVEEHILIPATSVKGALSHRVAFHYNRITGKHLSRAAQTIRDGLPEFDVKEAVEHYFKNLLEGQIPTIAEDEKWSHLEECIQAVQLDTVLEHSDWENFLRQLPNTEKSTAADTILPVGENNGAVQQLFGFAKEEKGKEAGARGKVIFSDVYAKKNPAEEKIFSHVMIDRYTGGALDGALYQEKAASANDLKLDIFVDHTAFDEKEVEEAFDSALQDLVNGRLQLGGNTTKGHGAFSGSFKKIINS